MSIEGSVSALSRRALAWRVVQSGMAGFSPATSPWRTTRLLWVRRVLVALSVVIALVPFGPEPAAACSPRTFESIHPPVAENEGEGAEAESVDESSAQTGLFDAEWTPPPPSCSFVYRMAFPVVGGGLPGWSVFGELREGGLRLHAGVDILAPKMTPVVAVRAGTVSVVRDTASDCCWVSVRHDDGWSSMYVHLNNDTVGTNDGDGVGIRPGLSEGDRVEKGELLGWIGDSGNAEGGPPHLHFELHSPWGEPVDPGPSLLAARRHAHPTLAEQFDGAQLGGAFVDYDLTSSARVFDTATNLGLTAWCDDLGLLACPRDTVSREVVGSWMAALAGRPVMPTITMPTMGFDLTNSSCLVTGCPETMVRGEIARLVISVRYPRVTVDTPETAIAFLHSRGEIDSCDPHGLHADATVSRAGALQMLLRAWGYLTPPPCDRIS